MDEAAVIEKTRRWISSIVIGLNLCPFAQRVFKSDLIRYVVTDTEDQEALLQMLSSELASLAQIPITDVETTLLIHPRVLGNFLDYVDFLTLADQRLRKLNLRGVIQIASFHPKYQFEGTDTESVENYTNRSPYPMLHLLREESISNLDIDPKTLLEIPLRNKRLLKSIGNEKLTKMLSDSLLDQS